MLVADASNEGYDKDIKNGDEIVIYVRREEDLRQW